MVDGAGRKQRNSVQKAVCVWVSLQEKFKISAGSWCSLFNFLADFFLFLFFSCGFYLFSIFSHIVAWLRSSFVYILFTQHIYWDVLIQFIHIFLFGITVYFFSSLLPTTREITKSLWISFNHFGHFKESIQNIIINHRKCQESLE